MDRIVAIHQPNFFPWPGYFDKIARSDVFIFLDDVAYPRSGSGGMGSWTNRTKLIAGEPRWIGCPLRHYHGHAMIRDVMIADAEPWRDKMLRVLDVNYRKAPRYAATMTLLDPLIRLDTSRLAELNRHAIERIAAHLGLSSRYVWQSELSANGEATERLVNLTKEVGGTGYLCGGGAAGYQEDARFPAAGLRLVYQNFEPRPYGPPERFVAGLSIVDYLMWDGRPLQSAWGSC